MSRQVQVTKNVFIGGDNGISRLASLQKIADREYRGSFSGMINDVLNKVYNLDPVTGEPRPESLREYRLCNSKNCLHAPPVPQRGKK